MTLTWQGSPLPGTTFDACYTRHPYRGNLLTPDLAISASPPIPGALRQVILDYRLLLLLLLLLLFKPAAQAQVGKPNLFNWVRNLTGTSVTEN